MDCIKILMAILALIFAFFMMSALDTPIKYVSIKGETCSCLVSGEKYPSKDQCRLVGDKYELIRVQKCAK